MPFLLSHSGDLLLCVGFVVRRPLNSATQELLGQSLPYLVESICRVRRQEMINSMTPPPHLKGRVFCGKDEKNIGAFF